MPENKNDRTDQGKKQNRNAEPANEAQIQAEKEISHDPDLSPEPDPAADLDEGELARLEGEE